MAGWLRALWADLRAVPASNRPRLLLLVGSLPDDMVGGAQVQAERAAAELSDRFDVVLLSRSSVRVAPGVRGQRGYHVVRRPVLPVPGLRPLADLAMCVWQAIGLGRGADAIVAYQTLSPGLAAVLAGRLLGVPTLVSIRGSAEYVEELAHPVRRIVNRAVWILADRILVQSPRVAEHFIERAPPRVRTKIGVAPNGIDLPPARTGAGEGLVFVGRIDRGKGLDVLVAALSAVPGAARPTTTVVGGGPLIGDLRGRAQELPITFVGETTRDQVLDHMRRAAVFVFPVTEEGMSNAVMEAMSLGVPVIASRVAGLPDLIVDGESGVLVPPGDVAALADAIQRLMEDGALRERLGTGGRHAVGQLSWANARVRLEDQIAAARRLGPHRPSP